jgi:hypothetical protein
MKKKLSVAGLTVVVAALVAASAFGAFTHHGVAAAAKGASAAGKDPNAIGVQVHGQWTIQVRSKSGRVVRTAHFHNDLTAVGASQIARVLDHTTSLGGWTVELFGTNQPCGGRNACDIAEPNIAPASFNGSPSYNLTVTSISGGFELEGTAVPDHDTNLTQVWTILAQCPIATAHPDCTGANDWGQVTTRILPAMIPVTAGQQVLAKVDLTFS